MLKFFTTFSHAQIFTCSTMLWQFILVPIYLALFWLILASVLAIQSFVKLIHNYQYQYITNKGFIYYWSYLAGIYNISKYRYTYAMLTVTPAFLYTTTNQIIGRRHVVFTPPIVLHVTKIGTNKNAGYWNAWSQFRILESSFVSRKLIKHCY